MVFLIYRQDLYSQVSNSQGHPLQTQTALLILFHIDRPANDTHFRFNHKIRVFPDVSIFWEILHLKILHLRVSWSFFQIFEEKTVLD